MPTVALFWERGFLTLCANTAAVPPAPGVGAGGLLCVLPGCLPSPSSSFNALLHGLTTSLGGASMVLDRSSTDDCDLHLPPVVFLKEGVGVLNICVYFFDLGSNWNHS